MEAGDASGVAMALGTWWGLQAGVLPAAGTLGLGWGDFGVCAEETPLLWAKEEGTRESLGLGANHLLVTRRRTWRPGRAPSPCSGG